MGSGYGNRTRWTVDEILTRNEQSRALGQKGLSNDQIGSAMEGVVAADLQASNQAEQQLMQHNREVRKQNFEETKYADQQEANKIGGYVQMGMGAYKGAKALGLLPGQTGVNPLTADNPAKQFVRGIQTDRATALAPNVPAEDMYGPNTIDATGAAVGTTQEFATEMGGYAGNFGAQQAAGEATDFVSDASGLTGALGKTAPGVTEGVETAGKAIDTATKATDAADMANTALQAGSTIGQVAGPLGAAFNMAGSLASGNYGKAAVDLAIYGIGMMLGPIGMIGSLVASFLPESIMGDVYSFVEDPGSASVVCTELFNRGWLTRNEYTLDAHYGIYAGKDAVRGYHKFGEPIARYMHEHDWFAYMVRPFGVYAARKLGNFIKGGREPLFAKVMRPICKRIGG